MDYILDLYPSVQLKKKKKQGVKPSTLQMSSLGEFNLQKVFGQDTLQLSTDESHKEKGNA